MKRDGGSIGAGPRNVRSHYGLEAYPDSTAFFFTSPGRCVAGGGPANPPGWLWPLPSLLIMGVVATAELDQAAPRTRQ
jgi:hypothetical protein